MFDSPINSNDLRLWLPEIVWLEPEYFKQAKEISNLVSGEAHQWQTYLNMLALQSFEQWLRERIPNQLVTRDTNVILSKFNLQVGEFKICLIATEHLLDEVVAIHQDSINLPEKAAHFYVVLEVLEEQEEVIVRGFLRYDQLVNYLRLNLQLLQDGCYQLPLAEFDAEPNHLLLYSRFLEATTIPLCASDSRPVMPSLTRIEEKLIGYFQLTKTNLLLSLQEYFQLKPGATRLSTASLCKRTMAPDMPGLFHSKFGVVWYNATWKAFVHPLA